MAEISNLVTVQSAYHHELLTGGLWNFFTTQYKVDLQVITPSREMVNAHQIILDVFLPPDKLNCDALVDRRSNLQTLLQFIYTGIVQVEAEELENLLWLGKELDFQLLVDAIEATIAETRSGAGGPSAGGNDPASDPATTKTRARRKGNPVKIAARRKGNTVKLRSSRRKGNPVRVSVDRDVPSDCPKQDKASLSIRTRTRSAGRPTADNCDSLTRVELNELAQPKFEGERSSEDGDDSNRKGSSSDESFDPGDEDEACSEPGENEKDDEGHETEFGKPVKQSGTTKASKAAGGTRKRRLASGSNKDTDGLAVDGGESVAEEEEAAEPTSGYCKRLRDYNREYNRNHPLIRCKQKPCTFRSRSKNSYQVHLATMHASGAELFPCPTCGKQFLDAERMKRHHHFTHSKASGEIDCIEFHQCPHCEYKTRYKPLYEVHMSRRHGESNAAIYRCDMCSKVFLHSEALDRHKRSHKQYKCKHCDFETTKTWIYSHHLFSVHRVNEKGQPVEKLQCPECDYKGKNQCVLRYHIATRHTPDKPYKCSFPQCTHASGRKSDRDRHYKIAHLDQRNYMCEFCSYRTITPYNLELHRRTHTGERPFQCETCSKKFVDRYHLKKHTKLHTSTEKPFLCHLCTFACNRRDNLRTHLKGVHKNQIANMDLSAVT